MDENSSRRILYSILAALLVYWVISPFLPKAHLIFMVSLAYLVAGVGVLVNYSRETYEIVFKGLRARDQDGSGRGSGGHIAVLSMWAVAFGVVSGALYSIVWVYYQMPQTWTGTPISMFPRACIAAGLFGVSLSPNITKDGIRLPKHAWIYVLFVVATVIVFFAGTRFGPSEAMMSMDELHLIESNRPHCEPDQRIWGSSNKVYHLPTSKYRAMVIPDWCFKTEEEAQAAGFRPAK